jgi:hypothetical protein
MASIEMKNFFMPFNNSNNEVIAKLKVKNVIEIWVTVSFVRQIEGK